MDGVRAVWTGSQLLTRNGNEIAAPEWVRQLPAGVALDGEIWGGRGNIQSTAGKVRSGDMAGLSFVVFDAPSASPFEARIAFLNTLTLPAFCTIHRHTLIKNRAHLAEIEDGIAALGGEGVVLRKARSAYVEGRSGSMLKIKFGGEDAEAEVVAHKSNSLLVRWAGKVFGLGTNGAALPAIGERVTFSFVGLTDAGIPRHASFVCVRNYE